MTGKRAAPWLGLGLAVGAFLAVRWFEGQRPLRSRREMSLRHDVRNLTLALVAAIAINVIEQPILMRVASWIEANRFGLLQRPRLPRVARIACSLLLLDYTLYVWHVLLHRVPLLWRCHVVHHLDRDLTASTALRFHFTEILLSVPWRIAQVALLGVSPRALGLWQRLALAEIVWHHSNIRLPRGVERVLGGFVVTPRMHGIHHSVVPEETNANWSSGLTVWDWLHGTLRLDVPQDSITIGVPAYQQDRDVTLSRILVLPFVRQRPIWRWPDRSVLQRKNRLTIGERSSRRRSRRLAGRAESVWRRWRWMKV